MPGHRGVVAAASYEARKFGIHSAMPINEAFRRCPRAVFLRPRMEVYCNESQRVMSILSSFSPRVEQVSVDEAFLDATGAEKLFGDGLTIAKAICKTIKDRLHLTASVGVAPNKFLAKLGSDMNKPDGTTQVPFDPAAVVSWLAPLPVGKLWGVGKKTEEVLNRLGILTIGDLQGRTLESLVGTFGKSGRNLYDLCRGIDDRPVENQEDSRSISREHTFEENTSDREELKKTLLALSQDVARQARRSLVAGRTIVLIFRGADFSKHTRRCTLAEPTVLANDIFSNAVGLLEALPPRFKFRLIGVGLTHFGEDIQLDLFHHHEGQRPWEKSEQAVDALTDRFGEGIVVRGTELK